MTDVLHRDPAHMTRTSLVPKPSARRRHAAVAAVAVVAAITALALPAAAQAPPPTIIVLSGPCALQFAPVAIAGGAFPPGRRVEVLVNDRSADAETTDAAGRFLAVTTAPAVKSSDFDRPVEEVATAVARDQETKAELARTTFLVTRRIVTFKPRRTRNVRRQVLLRMIGVPPGQVVYAHYLRARRLVRTVRIGKATGACGRVSRRLRFLPVNRPRTGTYEVRFDNNRRFDRKAQPLLKGTIHAVL